MSATPLILTADVRQWLGIEPASAEHDEAIAMAIEQASDLIVRYCGQPIKLASVVHRFDGTGRCEATPGYHPITQLTSLERHAPTVADPDTWEEVTGAVLLVSEGRYQLWRAAGFARGERYRATISVGYATVPETVQLACREMVRQVLKESDLLAMPLAEGTLDTQTRSINRGQVTETVAYRDLTPRWRWLLQPFRRVVV